MTVAVEWSLNIKYFVGRTVTLEEYSNRVILLLCMIEFKYWMDLHSTLPKVINCYNVWQKHVAG